MPSKIFSAGSSYGTSDMNIDRIDQVIASIKGEIDRTKDAGFNMTHWVSKAGDFADTNDKSNRGCGTVACIAGHAYMLSDKRRTVQTFSINNDRRDIDVAGIAARWLGIDSYIAYHLFHSPRHRRDEITLEQAIKVLEGLKATGQVDWDAAGAPRYST